MTGSDAGSERSTLRRRVLGLLQASRNPLVTGHVLADGDALGSATALVLGLRALGKAPRLVLHEAVPRVFRFLEPDGDVRLSDGPASAGAALMAADLAIVVDNNSWDRLGHLGGPLRGSGLPIVCLDHHVADAPFSEYHLLDLSAAATGVIVYELLVELGVAITPKMARALYASLVNDTGWFRYTNTDGRALRIAAALVDAGADPAGIAEAIGHHDRPEGKRALAGFLETLHVFGQGALVTGVVPLSLLERSGASWEETEDFVNQLRTLEGARLVGFLREERDGRIKLSFRSRRGVSARNVALRFGGGGHELAAGGMHPGPLSRARDDVEAAMRDELARAAPA